MGFGNIVSSTKQTKGGSEIWTKGRQFPTYLKPKNAIEEDEETAVENSKIASSAIAPFALPMLKLLHEIDK